MSLIARLFRFIFISLIIGGAFLMLYPAICQVIRSGLIYHLPILGLISAMVGLVGFAFVEIFMDDEGFMLRQAKWPPLPGDEDNAI